MASWALPVAIIGGIYLIREVKTSGGDIVDEAKDAAADAAAASQKALEDFLASVAASGEYFGTAARDAQREAAARAAVAEAIPVVERQTAAMAAAARANFGTVSGSYGAITGEWSNVTTGSGDRCSVDYPTVSGRATRFFTGQYCRDARAAGLIA